MRVLTALLCVAMVAPLPAAEKAEGDLETLVEWMSGSFSSAEQSVGDAAYYDIRLEMVPIWQQREDGHWLYIEQAAAAALDQPYRQRIYQVTASSDGVFESAVYELPDPATFTGAWRSPHSFDALAPEDLKLRVGCSVYLVREQAGMFRGGTRGAGCVSTLRGASYASSEVVVRPDRMESWDRGFRDDRTQAWGAEKGPYVFRRVEGDSER